MPKSDYIYLTEEEESASQQPHKITFKNATEDIKDMMENERQKMINLLKSVK